MSLLEDVMSKVPEVSPGPFEKKKILIYGAPGVGKSTLFSKFANHLFLNTDPGLSFLKVRNIPIDSWKKFVKTVDELVLKSSESKYKDLIVVLDIIDGIYSLCRKSVLQRYGLAHESDTPYGKTYDIVKQEFQTTLSKLAAHFGIGFISHSKDVEIKSRITSITKTLPTISGGAFEYLKGICDFIGYCEASTTKEEKALGERYITFTITENLMAKDRAGIFPEKMPLDFKTIYETYQKNYKNIGVPKKNTPVQKSQTSTKKKVLVKRKK